jgi:hypothetical protein
MDMRHSNRAEKYTMRQKVLISRKIFDEAVAMMREYFDFGLQ